MIPRALGLWLSGSQGPSKMYSIGYSTLDEIFAWGLNSLLAHLAVVVVQ